MVARAMTRSRRTAPSPPAVCGELYGDAGDDLLVSSYAAQWFDGGPGRDVYVAPFVPFDKRLADLIAPSPGIDTFDGSFNGSSTRYTDRPTGLSRLRRASDRQRSRERDHRQCGFAGHPGEGVTT